MALIGNRSVLLKSPGRFFGGSTVSDNRSNWGTPGSTRGRYFDGFAATDATPTGYRPPYSWIIAIKNGAMVSHNEPGVTLTATATGQSIFNMTGSDGMTFAATAPFLNATFPGYGSASMSFAATGGMRGDGLMTGSTIDAGVVTNASIAAAVIAAAQSTPIAANIKQVNDTTVHGTGAPGNEWGP